METETETETEFAKCLGFRKLKNNNKIEHRVNRRDITSDLATHWHIHIFTIS